MSADEDTELRDLVAQTLETNGVLGKIRAQLRASVFLALEEQESVKNKTPFANKSLQNFINTKEGRAVVGLVRDFLEHFQLEFSIAVFEPESSSGEHYEGRDKLARDLNIIESDETSKKPLLSEVLRRCDDSSHLCVNASSARRPSGVELSSASSVESKNKRNLESNDKPSSKENSRASPRSTPPTSPVPTRKTSSDLEDDFFDEPVPSNVTRSFNSDRKQDKTPGMSSLSGLPSLNGGGLEPDPPRQESNELEKDIQDIDQKIADLGFEVPDSNDSNDGYTDDDFESSNIGGGGLGPTPRSGRSDMNVGSIDEDIDEDIDEELSVADDLLKSDNSGVNFINKGAWNDVVSMDDLTTDRTISPVDHSEGVFDYVEDVVLP